MENAIRQLTHQLAEEAKAIGEYTGSINMTDDPILKRIFTELRNDELEHAQKLVVALTEAIGGSEPEVAENMDGNKGDGGE